MQFVKKLFDAGDCYNNFYWKCSGLLAPLRINITVMIWSCMEPFFRVSFFSVLHGMYFTLFYCYCCCYYTAILAGSSYTFIHMKRNNIDVTVPQCWSKAAFT